MAGFFALKQCLDKNDIRGIQKLVRKGTSVNCRDSWRRTILHHAAQQGKKEMIEPLVNLGGDINARDIERRTPLHRFFTKEGFTNLKELRRQEHFLAYSKLEQSMQSMIMDVLEIFVQMGADIQATHDTGVTSLHKAVQLQSVEGVRYLLKLGVDVNAPVISHLTVLTTASLVPVCNSETIMKHLIKQGADINHQAIEPVTPLYLAVESGMFDIVKILVQNGADINSRVEKWTALNRNLNEENFKISEFLLELGADINSKYYIEPVLSKAIELKSTKTVKCLVEHGADLLHNKKVEKTMICTDIQLNKLEYLLKHGADANSRYSVTPPLFEAIRMGNTEIVELFIKYGVNSKETIIKGGATALFLLVAQTSPFDNNHEKMDCVRVLLKHGADVNVRYDTLQPIHEAVLSGNVRMIRVFRRMCVDINNTRSWRRMTALSMAAEQENKVAVKLLADAGADVNVRYDTAIRALHDAISQSNTDMVEVLARSGADIHSICLKNITPLAWAAIKEKKEMMEILLQLGADFNARQNFLTCAIHLAVKQGDTHMVHVLATLGANMNVQRGDQITVLCYASMEEDKEMVRNLFNEGASIDARFDLTTPLHDAISQSDTEMVEMLVRSGADINMWCQKNITPLYMAAIYKKDREMVECLLDLGADVNAKFDTVNAIHMAVKQRDKDLVYALAALGANMNKPRGDQMTILCHASGSEDEEMVKILSDAGADIDARFDNITPLHDAISQSDTEMVEVLVGSGADINSVCLNSITPLYYAAIRRNKEMVEFLLHLGADVNAKNDMGLHAIHMAVKQRDKHLVHVLKALGADMKVERGVQMTILCYASGTEDKETVRILSDAGADTDATFDVTTALHDAISLSDTEMVEVLVNSGADINGMYLYNITPLYHAVINENKEMVEVLLYLGADLNAKCGMHLSVVHLAVKKGDKDMVRVLASLNADMNARRSEGCTALPISLREDPESDLDVLKALVKAGADLNARYDTGVNPLHDAVALSKTEMVKTLIKLGANPELIRVEGQTILHKAATFGRIDAIEFLHKEGIDLDAKSTSNITPFQDALRMQNIEMINHLAAARVHPNLSGRLEGVTALGEACHIGDKNMVKYLVGSGANINNTFYYISPFYDTVKDLMVTQVRAVLLHSATELDLDPSACQFFTLLALSGWNSDIDMTELLLKLGIDRSRIFTSGEVTRKYENMEYYRFFQIGPFHRVCILGNKDLARLLIIVGYNIKKRSQTDKPPWYYLPWYMDYMSHALSAASHVDNFTEVRKDKSHLVLCQSVDLLHTIPGLGNVQYLNSIKPDDVGRQVKEMLLTILARCQRFPPMKLRNDGSSAERTKIGMPDEMDFLCEVELEERSKKHLKDAKYGFMYMFLEDKKTNFLKEGSKGFHEIFKDEIDSHKTSFHISNKNNQRVVLKRQQEGPILDRKRRACSTHNFVYINENTKIKHIISIDTVPCLYIDDWPTKGIRQTWLMDHEALKKRGYHLIPKPPHVESQLAENYTSEELKKMWQISVAHLETEHMQHLEQRVKDVFITAKVLKDPDVTRVMFKDGDSLPRNTDRYISSYMLKMCFFKNIDYFRESNLSLAEMVCKVYDDLAESLSRDPPFIPIFFIPCANALDGLKLDLPKSAKVAKIMQGFVHALYLRDCKTDPTATADDRKEEVTIYQRRPTAMNNTTASSLYLRDCTRDPEALPNEREVVEVTVYQRRPAAIYNVFEI